MICVTGATGFVGRAACAALAADGRDVMAVSRRPGPGLTVIGDIGPVTDWSAILPGVQAVIHLAARVHVMDDRAADPLTAFRAANVAATLNLAEQAASVGVRRFVFVSSIKVNGEQTLPGQPFRAADAPDPRDPYGVSKREAEVGLRAIAARTGMEVVIVRPPLVYGPGVRANFASLMRLVSRGVPLPLGAVTGNRRSLIAVGNLADLLVRCVAHPAAANRTFLASDGDDMSTAELLRRLGDALGRPARLLPVSPAWLQTAATIAGQGGVARRLLGSLQVDATDTRSALGWAPLMSVTSALAATATAFRSGR